MLAKNNISEHFCGHGVVMGRAHLLKQGVMKMPSHGVAERSFEEFSLL
ncbi:MAG: hypothetical protein KF789_02695 [Bdellovibrionaceae bacterium]|nr:hypothetical protein [Pseudobdellovibrionaceae bacterium]